MVELHKFEGNDDDPVFINPLHVVAVKQIGDGVWIYVATPNANGWPFAFIVKNDIDEVLKTLRGR